MAGGPPPRSGKVAARLAQWGQEARADERRTVVLRTEHSTIPEEAERALGELGAHVQSAGPGAIVVVVTPEILGTLGDLPWVRAVEEPRPLQPRYPTR
jgi:hypothetical protein